MYYVLYFLVLSDTTSSTTNWVDLSDDQRPDGVGVIDLSFIK